ncbi:hypothetical protein Vadar_001433 [Vaccinium darrowii]|uniref:Uncharacterized protein n=1 Tax=Vaccinium darrowii TaxID=229202 RepID=A0ACB7X7A8_9ERIC|nr:hypothetical protein Vadar_001433 [Vaccinium darrowii]
MEELCSESKMDEHEGKRRMLKLKPGQICSIEDDINKLFEAIDIRAAGRSRGLLQQVGKDSSWKSAMKRPMRPGSSQASGIGISESVSLKQALRGLCLSQASEMAAMKRLSKQADSSRSSEAGTIKRLYTAVVVEPGESSQLDGGKGNLVEFSLVPEGSTSNLSKTSESGEFPKQELLNQHAQSCTHLVDDPTPKGKITKILPEAEIVPSPTHSGYEISMPKMGWNGRPKLTQSSSISHAKEKLPVLDEIIPTSAEFPVKSLERDKEQNGKLHFASSLSCDDNTSNNGIKSANTSRCMMRPVFMNKNFIKKKTKQDSTSIPCDSGVDHGLGPSTSKMVCEGPNCTPGYGNKEQEKSSPASSSANDGSEVSSIAMDLGPDKRVLSSSFGSRTRAMVSKADEKSRSREKGEFSQSSKSGDLHVLRQKQPNKSFSEQAARFYVAEVLLALESPAAEGVFKDLVKKRGLDSNFMIDSAGTINYHEGNDADPRMRAAAKRRGIQITSLSRPIRPSDFRDFDLILAMDKQNKEDILGALERWNFQENLPADAHKKVRLMCSYCKKHNESEVPDPYYGGPQGFEKVLDLLEDACESLLDSILVENKHISDS